jgi:hypothetical protein
MLSPDSFFDLYNQRANSLLSASCPSCRLTISSGDQHLVTVRDDGEIILSTATLLILVNVFFRMLTCPRILPDLGDVKQLEPGFRAYPGGFPNTLEELLDSSGGSIVQPDDQIRANLAKILADQAFDYLIHFLAASSNARSPFVNPTENQGNRSEYSSVLLADQIALTAMFVAHDAYGSRKKIEAVLPSKDSAAYIDRQQIRFLGFSVTTLFAVVRSMPKLPVAVRIVNIQQWCLASRGEAFARLIQQACNEAIIAIGEVTRQPPNLDGFNGVLNPASRKILAAASQQGK